MNQQLRHIKEEQGATIFMALLFMLVVALVCGTILAASTSALKSVHSDHDQRQAYLAVESAAKLVESQLADARFDYTRTQNFDADGKEVEPEDDSDGIDVKTTGKLAESPLCASIQRASSQLMGWTKNKGKLTRLPQGDGTYSVTLSAAGDATKSARMDDVVMTYSLQKSKNTVVLTANFALKDADESEAGALLYLYATGTSNSKRTTSTSSTTDGAVSGTTEVTTQSLSWNANAIKIGKGVLK